MDTKKSPKSYGVAVILCGVFGVIGVHHFYLGDWKHGIVDFLLLVMSIYLLATDQVPMALLFIAVDALHTIVVFYLLIIERWRDGQGRRITLT